jgi:L-aspartate oxidase
MMGGIKVNTWGETNIAGLFAAGEVACTGVHGANRLASNSMLEVLVFSKRIIEKGGRSNEKTPAQVDRKEEYRHLSQHRASKAIAPPTLTGLQSMMWEKAGIIRDRTSLTQAAETLAAWEVSMPEPTERASYELRNLVLTGRLLTEAGLIREESRGAHFRADFPHNSLEWQQHIVFTIG